MGLLRWFFSICLRIFFREIEIIGRDNIPATGPVIFVGNHNNQFVDALLLDQSVGSRIVRFLIAEKSYKRKFVGKFAKAMNSIPVARAQDNAIRGSGSITLSSDGEKIVGTGTSFKAKISAGDGLKIGSLDVEFRVGTVISDTELTLAKPVPNQSINDETSWKVLKKVDQGQVYKSVWDTLNSGECIGIFPEGGSHDRTDLLPIKAGVAIMALGAMDAHPHLQVRIVPCGLNYFRGHRFRSRVIVEFGPSILIERSLAEQYKTDKRGATATLLAQVEQSLRGAVVNVPDYNTLVAIHTARRMYTPKNTELTREQYMLLTKRFALADTKLAQDKDYQEIKNEMLQYNAKLRARRLRDKEVQTMQQMNGCLAAISFVFKFIAFFLTAALCLPGLLLVLPAGAIADNAAKKKAIEAKAGSDVKIKGLDVLATWKLMIALIVGPLFLIVYIAAIAVLVAVLTSLPIWAKVIIPIGSAIVLPLFLFYSVVIAGYALRLWLSLPPLLYASCLQVRHNGLKQQRADLEKKVKELVEVLGPKLIPNFNDERVIKLNEHGVDEQAKFPNLPPRDNPTFDDLDELDIAGDADSELENGDDKALKSSGKHIAIEMSSNHLLDSAKGVE